MTETTLYLVRHGETEYNRRRIMQGRRIDSSLNETGRRQARALARRFSGASLDAIYTSALSRSIETAEIVAVHHPDVPRYSLPGLDEMSWGVYEGEKPSDRLRQMLDRMYAEWDRGNFEHRVEEGESIYDVQERSVAAVDHIVANQRGSTVLVVAHGRLLRVLLASILDVGLERMNEFDHANTCVNVVTYRDRRYESSLLNCTAHLPRVDSVLME
ncbi:MAG: histidine phosphatase family protein [Rhodothermales bacterium]